ncbi:MAG: hypothetical protein K2H87_00525, partial [Duncaniella sp.]|nr:hypothetical protein [Duncaniella sp.]
MSLRTLIRPLLILLALVLIGAGDASARTPNKGKAKPKQKPKTERTMGDVKREQTATRKRIEETSGRLKDTDRELNRRMGELRSPNADIATSTARVGVIDSRIDSLRGAITGTSDSIAILETELEGLRKAYAAALNAIQPSGGRLNTTGFLFGAQTFGEAWSRLRYLRRFGEWRREKAEDISRQLDRIADRRQHLTRLRHDQDLMRREAVKEHKSLKA